MILLLLSCVEFEGDEGNLGFNSNLIAPRDLYLRFDPDEIRVVRGSSVQIRAARRLDAAGDEGDDPKVEGSLRGGTLIASEPGLVTFTGRRRVVVRWTGEVQDHFTVRFAPVHRLLWADHADAMTPTWSEPLEEAVLLGQARALPFPVDRLGRPLAWAEDDLELKHDCPEHLGEIQGPEQGFCTLTAELGGERAKLHMYALTEVVSLELDEALVQTDEGPVRALRARGRDPQGRPVLGLEIEWEGAGSAASDPFMARHDLAATEPGHPVTARYGELSVTLP